MATTGCIRIARTVLVALALALLGAMGMNGTALGATTGDEAIAPPRDVAWPGVIRLAVDATDLDHRILRVEQVLPVQRPGRLTLHYPRWLPGTHGPWEDVNELSGLTIQVGERTMEWRRDVVDPFSFHVDVPAGARELTIRLEHVSPLGWAQRRPSISPSMLNLRWNQALIYPAGHHANAIRVQPRVRLPAGWQQASALRDAAGRPAQTGSDGWVSFGETSLETLVDSPLMAGRHVRRVELDPPGAAQPVVLTVLADEAGQLDATPAQIEAHRRLVEQADRLFGMRPWRHYDMLLALSAEFGQWGLEHQESSENGARPNYFRDWDKAIRSRWIIPHEFAHAWNGKFRRPADLTTPNFNVPMRNSLLWVYEGLANYLEWMLTARSGLATREQSLDKLATVAAAMGERRGRQWRNLQDTTNDSTIMSRRSVVWPDWQRGSDYYPEGTLLWLDVDTMIREASGDTRSLDDFLRAFFGAAPALRADGAVQPMVYTFDDVVRALHVVQPLDWRGFLRSRLDGHAGAPLDGLARGGWKFTWAESESQFARDTEVPTGAPGRTMAANFVHSLGLAIAPDGRLEQVGWDSPAFRAKLSTRMTLLAVNLQAYRPDRLASAVSANKEGQAPLNLLLRDGDTFIAATIDWRGGLRYPQLLRDEVVPDRLSRILSPR